MRIRVLHGVGGVGKTRLAAEFGDSLTLQAWQACMLGSGALAFAASAVGNLCIIDYPEYQTQALHNLWQMVKNGKLPAGRWRFLLLSRDANIEQSIDQVLPHLRDPAIALKALAGGDYAWELFPAAGAQMQAVRQQSTPLQLGRAQFDAWQQQDAHHAEPLLILAFALNLLYDPSAYRLSRPKSCKACCNTKSRVSNKACTPTRRCKPKRHYY